MHTWWDDGDAGVGAGIALYARYTNPAVEVPFQDAARIVQARNPPYLDAANLDAVIRFKIGDNRWLGRTLAAIRETSDAESVTERALQDGDAGNIRAALLGLMTPNLPRVGVPIASAILALAMPDRFAIIDRFAMGEVVKVVTGAANCGESSDPALTLLYAALVTWVEDNDKLTAFEHFTAGLRQRSVDLGTRTPRDIEKALFGYTLDRRSRARRR